ncbi:Paxillin homolog 1 [Caenorhabditis elegans]|uniref:Isoform c of Paxillin homolog 1 n=1 Tax=Caenorhabditis elegans TaxID=6239 RepID=Q09476-3|nr:Paxillin homolog 1 [Caenorhabditis elegans]ABW99676.1 pxl-1 isoform c [Caenorhabditis elegans]CCD65976.1 Paxillin homolog 1 [Caenorhabditis elegans]|eukprot:NP_001122677.1 Paxillin homolog 1 [Caenorhabditis elegans]
MPSDDRFADAVKPALEALLSDLQHTTEVLRRAHISDRRSQSRDDFEQSYDLQGNLNTQSSRKSLGPPSQAQSYSDVRSNGRSPSRDPLHSDSMIGTMNGELSSKHGVNTIPKGDCAACGKPIIGQVVIALGKMWHPEHYTCCECGAELGQRPFFERNGRAFCEEDYHNQFSPKCQGCHRAITDRCVSVMNKNFHIECFTCAECNQPFGEDGFHEKNGQTYCKRDFFRLFAPKCNGCSQPITSNFITALGTHWHPDCFVCQHCGVSFNGASFFEHNGAPLCERHYHESRGSICSQCRGAINGRCVAAMGRKFHPEHFRCSYCNHQLTKGTFKEVDRRPFCHKCYNNTYALTPA